MIDLPHSSNCSSASEAMCQFFDERGYPVSVIQADYYRAQLKLIDSQYHKRLRRKTLDAFPLLSHFTLTTAQLNLSF